jgi:hypothetical protein
VLVEADGTCGASPETPDSVSEMVCDWLGFARTMEDDEGDDEAGESSESSAA